MSTIVTLIEYPQVSSDMKKYFILTKLFNITLMLCAAIILRYFSKIKILAHVLALITMFSYPALGEMFRPTYENALLPVFIISSMFIPVPRKYLFTIIFLSSISFCAVYYYNYERNLKLASEMNVFDNMWSIFSFAIVAAVTAHTLNFERDLRNKAQGRYSLIGKHAAAILHDLKNIISTPLLQITELRSATKNHNTLEIESAISDIETTLSQAASLAIRFNQMTVLANTEKSRVKISETILEVKTILNRRLNGVTVDIIGDHALFADQGFITSLFLNLFMNSLAAMAKSDLKKIMISIDSKKICFQDTGTGFNEEALKHINKNLTFTDKVDGSGNGLRIIKEACLDLGAKVKFFNTPNGATVEILI